MSLQLPFRDDSRVREPIYIACVCVLVAFVSRRLSSAVLIADLRNARRGLFRHFLLFGVAYTVLSETFDEPLLLRSEFVTKLHLSLTVSGLLETNHSNLGSTYSTSLLSLLVHLHCGAFLLAIWKRSEMPIRSGHRLRCRTSKDLLYERFYCYLVR